MASTNVKSALITLALLVLSTPAVASEKWLKVMPDDPYSNEGSFHMFDIDSAFEDGATGLVAARLTYEKPATVHSGAVKTWYVWAFDCDAGTVYYVSNPAEAGKGSGTRPIAGWHDKPSSLAEPVMGGVTNTFGKKLCALKGSWPKGKLP